MAAMRLQRRRERLTGKALKALHRKALEFKTSGNPCVKLTIHYFAVEASLWKM